MGWREWGSENGAEEEKVVVGLGERGRKGGDEGWRMEWGGANGGGRCLGGMGVGIGVVVRFDERVWVGSMGLGDRGGTKRRAFS